jgi:hypothetical protein
MGFAVPSRALGLDVLGISLLMTPQNRVDDIDSSQ